MDILSVLGLMIGFGIGNFAYAVGKKPGSFQHAIERTFFQAILGVSIIVYSYFTGH